MLALTVRLIVSLAIVVGLLLLIARFGARRFRGKGDALVQVVHRQALSRTTGVAVVAVGSRVLVLGTTENQVTVLTELDPHEIDASELDAALEDETIEEPELVEVLPPRPQARAATRPVAPPAPSFRSARPAARVPVTPPPVPSAAEVILAAAAQFEETGEVRPAVREEPAQTEVSAALAILHEEAAAPIQLNRRTATALSGSGPLAGSVLSAQTWKQAFAVVRGSGKKAS